MINKESSTLKTVRNEFRSEINQKQVRTAQISRRNRKIRRSQLGNVSQACKYFGYSRDTFYRYRELVETDGELALKEIGRRKPIIKNRIDQEIEDIDHSKTKARSPQTNGICECFHRTMQVEFYATAFRKKIYRTIEELQNDVDIWLKYYNNERPHSGKYCYGKTPMQTWKDSLHLTKEKLLDTLNQNFVSLTPSNEEETGAAGEQLVRNNSTGWNGRGG